MRILVAIDRSPFTDAVIDAVLRQFRPSEHQVRVFHAVAWQEHLPTAYPFAVGPHAGESIMKVRDDLMKGAAEDAEAAAGRLRRAGFLVEVEIAAEGHPSAAILEAAAHWPADLIVVGSHGRSGLDRFLLGSVSDHVVRHAKCSVEVVRQGGRRAV
jgi:nucleotide-binding universal stress UspA family protein